MSLEMFFAWWRNFRRKQYASRPFPDEWETMLRKNVPHYVRLTSDEQARLRRAVLIITAEKYFEGCQGLEITDEIRVTIAGMAGLLVLGFENEYFDRLLTILVYPDAYVAPDQQHGPGGIVTESAVPRLGEAWHTGPIILTWSSVLEDARLFDGQNVVLHEFAHYLDMQDGFPDGTPPLPDLAAYQTWDQVMSAEYNRMVRQADRGRLGLLDEYSLSDRAEFFAGVTEVFFERPRALAHEHPRLYDVLRGFYRQDPLVRFRGESTGHE